MKKESSQVQLQKEIMNVSNKLDKLDVEIRLILKRTEQQRNGGLEKGLRELKMGKGHLYKSLKEWSTAMKA